MPTGPAAAKTDVTALELLPRYVYSECTVIVQERNVWGELLVRHVKETRELELQLKEFAEALVCLHNHTLSRCCTMRRCRPRSHSHWAIGRFCSA